jgi:hypothetical protein
MPRRVGFVLYEMVDFSLYETVVFRIARCLFPAYGSIRTEALMLDGHSATDYRLQMRGTEATY